MQFLHEVTEINHTGGPWGRGYLRAETPVTPDDWFFKGHFKNEYQLKKGSKTCR